ncbi:hypothetical protein BDF19DRAFT_293942 [Syncephalis fuscata]|nr:hypothetical protein BDF19DRAFT_293942 [Syncephalis fuscata]
MMNSSPSTANTSVHHSGVSMPSYVDTITAATTTTTTTSTSTATTNHSTINNTAATTPPPTTMRMSMTIQRSIPVTTTTTTDITATTPTPTAIVEPITTTTPATPTTTASGAHPTTYRGLPFPAWPALVRRSHDMPVTPPNGMASISQSSSLSTADNMSHPPPEYYGGNEAEHPENRVQAYAKLEGEDFCYFVQSLEVIIGRRTTNTDLVHVNLGAAKAVSRRHARIHYNMREQRFEMSVFGKNGVFINEEFVASNATVVLPHG